jgi:hypothetical protein
MVPGDGSIGCIMQLLVPKQTERETGKGKNNTFYGFESTARQNGKREQKSRAKKRASQ